MLKCNALTYAIISVFFIAICGQILVMFHTQTNYQLDFQNGFQIEIEGKTTQGGKSVEGSMKERVDTVVTTTKNATETNAVVEESSNITNTNHELPEKKEDLTYPDFDNRNPDGTFNGYNLYYENYKDGWHSNAHCIGENFRPDAWRHRSCHFQNLCFDMDSKEYVLFTSPEQVELEHVLRNENLTFFDPASSMNTTVAIGGLNPKWGDTPGEGINTMEWYPRLVSTDEVVKSGYYTLHPETVLVPYHSFAGHNPGHLVWDDFLPLYTLLSSFQLEDRTIVPVLYFTKNALWASTQKNWIKCQPMLKKFLPLLGASLDQISSQNDTKIDLFENKKSKYVCGPRGASGLGMLTDHGLKLHGWKPQDYAMTHNIGRAGSIYAFRNWMMHHIGIKPEEHKIHNAPHRIVFSVSSSFSPTRSASFQSHFDHLKQYIAPKYNVDIQMVNLSKMKLSEQIELMAGTSILITMCGGGAVTATFLPKGASLFVYFNEQDGHGRTPARLDWDFLNNMGHVRTHWLPRAKPTRATGSTTLVAPDEIDMIAFEKLIADRKSVV